MGFIFGRRPWAIHNPLKSWTLAGLSLRECQLLVASMTDAEMKVSWAHRSGWPDWRPLGDQVCHDLFLLKDSEHILPELPQMSQEDDHEITEVRSLSSAPKEKAPIQRRHPRYIARFPVEVVMGTYTFSTFTLDFSEGGFFFEDPLPEWVAGYFTVVLKAPGENFEFNCFLAEDQKKEKFRSEIAPTTSEKVIERFREWLEKGQFPNSPVKD